ncbi:hypothetical protein A8O28_19960 [Enterobacteriaceae bacterium CCUG 67584]|nr:hypothetical protein [Enterobacteriaceae bacterium CCUG 67584]
MVNMLVFSEVNKSESRKCLFTRAQLSHDPKKKKTVTHVAFLEGIQIYPNM